MARTSGVSPTSIACRGRPSLILPENTPSSRRTNLALPISNCSLSMPWAGAIRCASLSRMDSMASRSFRPTAKNSAGPRTAHPTGNPNSSWRTGTTRRRGQPSRHRPSAAPLPACCQTRACAKTPSRSRTNRLRLRVSAATRRKFATKICGERSLISPPRTSKAD